MKNYKKKILILFLLLLPLQILFISNTSANPVDDTSLQDVIDAGKIVVGIEAGYPPFEERDPVTDEIIGFDPDIMQYIADDIGVEIEWVDVAWSVIFTGLILGDYDCIISAVTITAEREEVMDFSRWYYRNVLAVMVNDDNPMGIENLEDINSTDVKVGYQAGTSSNWYVEDEGIVAEQYAYVTIPLAVEALKQGIVDVVLGDYCILKDIKETDSELLYIVDTFGIEDYGIPVQTGFDSLRLRINSILDELLGADINQPEPNAYYTASYQEWFGGDPYFGDTSLQDVIDAGKIVVGIEAGYPPFEERDPVTDEIIGFDPDIMQYIADDIGVEIEWVDVAWSDIFTGLVAGNYDCIISAVTITAEREEVMDFSRWYYRNAQAVLVNDDNPKNINSIYDINSTDINVGYQEGTTSELYLADNNFTAAEFGFTTITLAIEALNLGTVDVVLGDHATLLAGMDAGTMEVVDTFSPEDFGIPVQTGSDSLRLRINSILDDLLGTDINQPETNAYYTASYEEWFGIKPPYSTSTYYTISASCGNNGDINPEGEIEVRGGDDIEFDFTPDDGYVVDKVLVDGISVEIQRDFTFNNVDSDHTIEVEFAEDPDESAFDIPGYSIVSFIIISFAMVSIITVKIHQRRLN